MNDKIYSSNPVNKTAALVTGRQPNDEIDIGSFGHTYMSLQKPPVLPFKSKRKDINLIGLSYGKLIVIGVFIKQTEGKKLKWVVQCKCGYYTIRVSNTIRRKIKNNEYDECIRCSRESDRGDRTKI